MSDKKKTTYRKTHLFARSLDEVVKVATKPMMDKQSKLYSALLANWPAIVGSERARVTRPGRLQFPTKDAHSATLHLDVHPAKAPEMHYASEQILEQCARYFGYRAIQRIVFHPCYDLPMAAEPQKPRKTDLSTAAPADLSEVLQRMRQRIMSGTPESKS